MSDKTIAISLVSLFVLCIAGAFILIFVVVQASDAQFEQDMAECTAAGKLAYECRALIRGDD